MAQQVTPTQRLVIRQLSKSFGGVRALDEVDLEVRAGEIHGLVGENGAGKSTLIKIASGIIAPDGGEILLDGRPLPLNSPPRARSAGLAVVHQESELFPHLSVTENMFLAGGFPTNCCGGIAWSRAHALARGSVARLGEELAVRLPAGRLSVAQRMIAEIAAAVDEQATVLFLDEPTASLTQVESSRLFVRVRQLAQVGVSVVYVSHRLEEITELCDRVSVLRDGQHVVTARTTQLTPADIVAHMVGRQVDQIFPKSSSPRAGVALEVQGLTSQCDSFTEISLHVKRGEVVSLYGLIGAGRTELAEALFGLRPLAAGRIVLLGKSYRPTTPGAAVRAGIAYLPEDRLVHGTFPRLTLYINALVAVIRRWSWWGFLDSQEANSRADDALDAVRVRRQSGQQPIRSLSGGNQQKVMFGRWLLAKPEVLVLDEPTRGIDVSAKAELHQRISDWANEGRSILLISSELPEALGMADRVYILREGRLVAEFDPRSTGEQEIAAAALPAGRKSTDDKFPSVHQREWTQRLRGGSLAAALLALSLLLILREPQKFASLQNIQDIAAAAAIPYFVALGATFVIAAGGIDISVGSILALCAALCGLALQYELPIPLAIATAVVAGAFLGAMNATLALAGRIHPIVVTLATMGIFRGLLRVVTGERRIQDFPDPFRALTESWWFGVRPVIWYALLAILAGTWFLSFTRTGRSLLAVGDSPTAAAMIGLNRSRLQLLAFTVSGALTGCAGVLWAASYGIVDTYTAVGWELKAIAAAVIGGCLISGGTGTAWGAALGAVVLELIRNALVILGVSAYWEGFFLGGLILLVVFMDSRMRGN